MIVEDKFSKLNVTLEKEYTTIETTDGRLKWLRKQISDTYTTIKNTEKLEDRFETE